ncbi:conserved hypothetical protein [uncultured Stenotrophomonas sp.]|uniref:Uncharacterized protein n=1 Tax=uncultured Stenotrophomonas sp. TaxID=165438 RepID=A0A1Y5QBJ3_9GAMM|nr:conserved hypothetical protein [uncultured Stenotrophomonas sp.]
MQQQHVIDATAARLQLPLLALHCLRATANKDRAHANLLRLRSAGEQARNHRARSRRMGVASRLAAAAARDMATEVRQ